MFQYSLLLQDYLIVQSMHDLLQGYLIVQSMHDLLQGYLIVQSMHDLLNYVMIVIGGTIHSVLEYCCLKISHIIILNTLIVWPNACTELQVQISSVFEYKNNF